jgi:hypothetical protein
LFRGQDIFEQRAELDLSPAAPRFHVRQHALQVAHAGGQISHIAQPLVNHFQPLRDLPERLSQPLFQRSLQLFRHGAPHLFQLLGIVGLHLLKPPLYGLAQ